jgi:hypothetical protein
MLIRINSAMMIIVRKIQAAMISGWLSFESDSASVV